MKHYIRKIAATATACLALAQPQALMAQECIDQGDVSDTGIYAMPILYSGFTSKCGDQLSDSGFIAQEGDAFIAPYIALQDEKWPAAARMLTEFSKKKGGEDSISKMLSAVPAEALRPFLEAILQQKVAEDIKVKDCGKIERGISAFAPLPPENVGSALAFILDMSGVENPSLCPYEPE